MAVLPLLSVAQSASTSSDSKTSSGSRDWRTWPFTSTSPWNHPIGLGANYADVAGLNEMAIGINYDDRWTSSIVVAKQTDPEVSIFLRRGMWEFLSSGGRVCGNSPAVEAMLKESATRELLYPANYYSTIAVPDTSLWILPSNYKPASASYSPTAHVPVGACPSPDTDGLMAVFQPDGWVLDLYEAVVLSDGSIVAAMASYVDARSDGTGWWNGRRASMLPSFAGLIRDGELQAGRIPHALAVTMSPTLLKDEAVWPAYAFDRNSGYSGTLPLGTLLAIPKSVNLETIGLSRQGVVLAQAARSYGAYVVDRGGRGGMTVLAQLGNREIRWPRAGDDLAIIRNHLTRVTNNFPRTPGGGGTPLVSFAPPLNQ